MAINLFYILLLLSSCDINSNEKRLNNKVEVVNIDSLDILSEQWKNDSLGCDKIRSIEFFEKLFKEYSLEQKNEEGFLKILGMPNTEEKYADKKIIVYYFHSICKANRIIKDSDKSSIRITFDLQKRYKSYDTRIE
jgi:hypothetical protein